LANMAGWSSRDSDLRDANLVLMNDVTMFTVIRLHDEQLEGVMMLIMRRRAGWGAGVCSTSWRTNRP
jgi:hypothetical protein